eukprot:TRINITY_DN1047_c0_g1_i1.p1 TRINITY_DN1047_c0_g1~~TRINITY_DN1047_c0_g1_i1.p1  ORF type:complete len:596 (+),score=121.64 TRINITY_DN1047_c0_g1_i1:54-1841(+)
MSGTDEMLATVRVLGVPFDTDDEMFSRWFLFARGFMGAAITTASDQGQVGFVLFSTLENATAAIHALDGRTLSSAEAPGGVVTLGADLAKNQLRLNGPRPFSELEAQPKVQLSSTEVTHRAENPPSNAIVISNLSIGVSDKEIIALTDDLPGFLEMTSSKSDDEKKVVCLHFECIDTCAAALSSVRSSSLTPIYGELLDCQFAVAGDPQSDDLGVGNLSHKGDTRSKGGGLGSSTLLITSMPMGYTEKELTSFVSDVCGGFKSLRLSPSSGGRKEACLINFASPEQAHAGMERLLESVFSDCTQDKNFKIEFAGIEGSHNGRTERSTSKTHGAEAILTPTAKHPSPAYAMRGPAAATAMPNSMYSGSDSGNDASSEWQQQQQQQQEAKSKPVGNEKCSTVFTSNLHRNCTEDELTQFFGTGFDGFIRLKFSPSTPSRGGMCWIRFASIDSAENAIAMIRSAGMSLSGDPGKPLQVDFARNDLDCRGVDQRAGPAHETTTVLMGNPPCDTLFVGSVPPEVTEEETHACLALLPGFLRMKFVASGIKSVAFAQFDSVESAVNGLSVLKESAFPSAPTQPIECEYSKNSLDNKRPRYG